MAQTPKDELAEAVAELRVVVGAQRSRNGHVYDTVRDVETRVVNLGIAVEQLRRRLDDMRTVLTQQCRLSDLREERRRETVSVPGVLQTSADSITPHDLFMAAVAAGMWAARGAYSDRPGDSWPQACRSAADRMMEQRRRDDEAR